MLLPWSHGQAFPFSSFPRVQSLPSDPTERSKDLPPLCSLPTPGDAEQDVMLTTKAPKATVGGLSPSKGYTVQIFRLTGSGTTLLAQREFVSKSVTPPLEPSRRA